MIKCAICGLEKEYSIAEHLKYVHNMKSIDYKEKFGLEVRSEEFKKKTSEYSKQVWQREGFSEKMSLSRKETHNTEEFKQKMSKISKKRCEDGLNQHFVKKGLSKDTDASIRERSAKISKALSGRENPEHSLRMKSVWMKQKEENPEKWRERNIRRSESICKLIAENDGHNLGQNQYKRGYYKDFYYASSYEERLMIDLDNNDKVKSWTNKHGIVIRYIDETGRNRGYIPDFKIELINDIVLIVETKAEKLIDTEEVQLKKEAALKLYENYFLISTVEECREIINDKCKD